MDGKHRLVQDVKAGKNDFWNKESAENLDKYTNQIRQHTAQEIFKDLDNSIGWLSNTDTKSRHYFLNTTTYNKIKQKYLGNKK